MSNVTVSESIKASEAVAEHYEEKIKSLEERLEYARQHGKEQFNRICELESQMEKLEESDLEVKMIRKILGYYD